MRDRTSEVSGSAATLISILFISVLVNGARNKVSRVVEMCECDLW